MTEYAELLKKVVEELLYEDEPKFDWAKQQLDMLEAILKDKRE